ncbi:membrane protein insertion efficiency factor YidD [Tessaracoccus defluvii]|uniref:membrane protein insertion efficiency factor YidD n=1 Tax=Tessaracoccus defluvii TaxID=1285901 RepID=UPI003872B805
MYGDVCKYHPTCSAYGLRALEVHGAVKGVGLIIGRLARCHPWSMGGVDYVPGARRRRPGTRNDRRMSGTNSPGARLRWLKCSTFFSRRLDSGTASTGCSPP